MKTKFSAVGNIVGVKNKDVPVVVRELKRIEKAIGSLTPATVVEAASGSRSPLHRYFTWDDSLAAAKYREWQARVLIGCVQVTIKDASGGESTVRAFVSVSPTDEGVEVDDLIAERGYMSVEKAARNSGYKGQVIQYAYNQLVNWKRRFGGFKEFFEVTEAIGRVKRS